MSPIGPRRRTGALAGCFLMAAGINAYVLAPASLLPLLIAEFTVSKSAAGLLISAVFAAWLVFQIPGGFLTDRTDNRWLVGAGVVVYVLASTVGGVVEGYHQLLLTRFIGGSAAVFLWATNANVVAQLYPDDRRATATGVFLASAPVGLALAQLAGPPLASAFGWRVVFFAYPPISVLGLVLLLGAVPGPIFTSGPPPRQFREVLSQPTVLLVSLSSFCAYSLFLFFNSWMPTYATEVLRFDLGVAGAAASLVAFVGVVARPMGGWLAGRLGSTRPVVVGAFVLVAPALLTITAVDSAVLFGSILLLAGFSTQLSIGAYYPYVSEVTSPESVGVSLALLTAMSVFGSLTAPVLFGYIIETYSWTLGFVTAGLFIVAGVGFVLRVPAG